MKFGVALGRLNPAFFVDATVAADALGYESVWLPEHLVFTAAMSRSPHPGETHPPVPPRRRSSTRSRTSRSSRAAPSASGSARTCTTSVCAIRSSRRARVQTLDIVSGGRVEFGVGASWLEEEWIAARARLRDPRPPGRRGDRGLPAAVDRAATVVHHGEHFHFDGVVFEPKPVQRPGPPVLVGGESVAALRRAARLGDGWIGMGHTFESATAQIARLRELLDANGRGLDGFQVCLGGPVESPADVERVGVDRRHPPHRLALAPLARRGRRPAPLRRAVGLGTADLARWGQSGTGEQVVGMAVRSRGLPTLRNATGATSGCRLWHTPRIDAGSSRGDGKSSSGMPRPMPMSLARAGRRPARRVGFEVLVGPAQEAAAPRRVRELGGRSSGAWPGERPLQRELAVDPEPVARVLAAGERRRDLDVVLARRRRPRPPRG